MPWRPLFAASSRRSISGPLVQDGQIDLRISPGPSYLVRVNRHLLVSAAPRCTERNLFDAADHIEKRLTLFVRHNGNGALEGVG